MKIALSVSDKEKAKGREFAYFKALHAAGAELAQIEMVTAANSPRIRAEEFDGILFAGGADVDPEHYGEERRYENVKIDAQRDEFEFRLLDRARRSKLPILGICRGLQLINVGFGGTLYQDLKEDKNLQTEHEQTPAHSRRETTHAVTVTEPDSQLASAVPGGCRVNSMHHQAVKQRGRGLKATAYSEDEIVEALEAADGYPLLAVQWHPEEIADRPEQRKIFEQFVAKCRQRGEKSEARRQKPA